MGLQIIGAAGGGGVTETPSSRRRTYGSFGLLQEELLEATSTNPTSGPSGSGKSLGVATQDLDGIELMFDVPHSARPVMIDISVGGTVKVRRYPFTTVNFYTFRKRFPIFVPAGAEVRVNAVSVVNPTSVQCSAVGYTIAGEPEVYSEIAAIGPLGGSLITTGAVVTLEAGMGWTELVAETSSSYEALGLYVGNNNQSAGRTAGRFYLDIGLGAAGAEAVLVPAIMAANAGNSVQHIVGEDFAVQVPNGSRLAVRRTPGLGPAMNATVDRANVQLMGSKL